MSYRNNSTDIEGRIFVGGLDHECDEEALQKNFSMFGDITQVSLIRNRETNESRGFAFISFKDQSSAEDSIRRMNGVEILGRCVTVKAAVEQGTMRGDDRPRRGFFRGGGRGGGRGGFGRGGGGGGRYDDNQGRSGGRYDDNRRSSYDDYQGSRRDGGGYGSSQGGYGGRSGYNNSGSGGYGESRRNYDSRGGGGGYGDDRGYGGDSRSYGGDTRGNYDDSPRNGYGGSSRGYEGRNDSRGYGDSHGDMRGYGDNRNGGYDSRYGGDRGREGYSSRGGDYGGGRSQGYSRDARSRSPIGRYSARDVSPPRRRGASPYRGESPVRVTRRNDYASREYSPPMRNRTNSFSKGQGMGREGGRGRYGGGGGGGSDGLYREESPPVSRSRARDISPEYSAGYGRSNRAASPEKSRSGGGYSTRVTREYGGDVSSRDYQQSGRSSGMYNQDGRSGGRGQSPEFSQEAGYSSERPSRRSRATEDRPDEEQSTRRAKSSIRRESPEQQQQQRQRRQF